MLFEAFLKELNKIPQLEDLRPDKQGVYSLRINHIHYVYFSHAADQHALYLYAPLCPIPFNSHHKSVLFEILMTANFLAQNSGNGWFANDKLSHQIFYVSRIPEELLSKARFVAELQKFISCLSHWKNQIDEIRMSEEPRPSEASLFYIKP